MLLAMVEKIISGQDIPFNVDIQQKLEEDEEDFRSCCEDEDELDKGEDSATAGFGVNKGKLKEGHESVSTHFEEDLDEHSVKMYFKGISVAGPGDSSSGLSGIGVVMEGRVNFHPTQVQKKLDFLVEESVADYLALMDGLLEALRNKTKRVFAFTDSETLYSQITNEEKLENPLLVALRQRILEHASCLDMFVVKYSPSVNLDKALNLAQVAIGVVSASVKGNESIESCSICCDEKLSSMMITLKCSHQFCSQCMRTFVEGKVQSAQCPIKCPQLGCKYFISLQECRCFLPVTSYESFERALEEANVMNSEKFSCPYPNCSALLDPHDCLSSRASSSSQPDSSCMECPLCQRFICLDCGRIPWHASITCEEYQNLPLEERDSGDVTLHLLAQNKRWQRCQQCRRMIELTHGCYHMTCWCGHQFCYSCGTEYRDGRQTCPCAFWDEDNSENLETQPAQQYEQWAWDSFESLPMLTDAYTDQERSQLALIQRFLAGGFSLMDHNPYQSPPRCTDSYVDAMKDLHQLPWLERFVSVISDNYYEDYIQ